MTDVHATTIYAESTPQGFGGLSTIRLSGPETLSVLHALTGRDVWPPHTQRPALIQDAAGVLDQAMVVFHPGPHSYTGEDVSEISCHGNPLIVRALLDAIQATGLACPAGRGEFTRRAFLNGKLDLAQAEAVGALIEARSLSGVQMAGNLLAGGLSDALREILAGMQAILADIEASFLIEDGEFDVIDARERTAALIVPLEEYLRNTAAAPALFKGITTIIAGLPNAGKSSLFNALLGFERAIVHEEAGTTRDIITEHVLLSGIDFIFHDTAGIRETSTGPEKIGIDRTLAAIRAADLVLYVVDARCGFQPEEHRWLVPGKTIIALNKIDLDPVGSLDIPGYPVVRISAKTGSGITDLIQAMQHVFPQELPAVFLERHLALLQRAKDAMQAVAAALEDASALDVLTLDLREAIRAIRTILGEETRADILDMIFATFCVGK